MIIFKMELDAQGRCLRGNTLNCQSVKKEVLKQKKIGKSNPPMPKASNKPASAQKPL